MARKVGVRKWAGTLRVPTRRAPSLPVDFTPDTLPSKATETSPVAPTSEDGRQTYSLLMFNTGDFSFPLAGRTYSKSLDFSGDHCYVAELTGAEPIFLRFGRGKNPWIRIHEGMSFHHPYSYVTVAHTQSYAPGADSRNDTQALLYLSKGPLVLSPPSRSYGLRRPVDFVRVPVTTVPDGVIDPSAPALRKTVGIGGGSALILNTDLTNTVWLGYAPLDGSSVPLAADRFPLEAGRSLSLPLDGPMGYQGFGLVAFTLSGTATLRVLVSGKERDSLNPVQTTPRGFDV
jgi:hypothetical protein